jgi:hypothetical protein
MPHSIFQYMKALVFCQRLFFYWVYFRSGATTFREGVKSSVGIRFSF